MQVIDALVAGLTKPEILFGHFTYALLITSMLMRRMVTLRLLAVASGVTKIVYRAIFVFDPVSVLWETVFVLVNVIQLLLIWYYDHHHSFRADHQHFVDNIPAGVDRSAIKRLLDLSDLETVPPGTILTHEGEKVSRLTYIADGIVKIEKGDRVVAICGPGDYIGELSFLTGNPASATSTTVKPTRVLVFDQARLTTAIEADGQLRRTLETALNRNLAGKLTRSSEPQPLEA
jgi:hypothetical protein